MVTPVFSVQNAQGAIYGTGPGLVGFCCAFVKAATLA